MNVEGCTALFTGAHRGFGRALVQALLDGGAARVRASARDTSTPQPLVAASLRMTEGVRAELPAQGTRVMALMTGAMDTDLERGFWINSAMKGDAKALENELAKCLPG